MMRQQKLKRLNIELLNGLRMPYTSGIYHETILVLVLIWCIFYSYEPNFLFNDDEDDEIEFVCDCCDPKRRKKKPSSEECSEEELSDKDASEEEEDEEEGTQSKLGDEDSNDLLEEDSEDSRGFASREDSPAVETTPLTTAKSSKPLPPGWFGKGRSKKRRK